MRRHCIMNWKGCGRERKWYSLRECLCACQGELRVKKETSVYFSNDTRTGNPSNTSQTCYRLTHLYIDFNTEASCKYSGLCAAILCNTWVYKLEALYWTMLSDFPKKSVAFEKVPRLRPLVLLIIVVLRKRWTWDIGAMVLIWDETEVRGRKPVPVPSFTTNPTVWG
jgi:hypothetical protein